MTVVIYEKSSEQLSVSNHVALPYLQTEIPPNSATPRVDNPQIAPLESIPLAVCCSSSAIACCLSCTPSDREREREKTLSNLHI